MWDLLMKYLCPRDFRRGEMEEKMINNSTHIPVCSSYSYKSLNVNRNNYTIRYIPYLCMDETEKDVKKKHQEKNKVYK